VRGANLGPIGIRDAFLKTFGGYPKSVQDLGDVFVIPQLLHDEMLSDIQLSRSRNAIYPGVTEPLPVSPLSIMENVLYAAAELNPGARVISLGGDHSISWPAVLGCCRRFEKNFGILHFDAHTDLMESRLGVRYCFATWAFHALKLMKPRSLVQVGVRTSLKTKQQWERELPVVQFWAHEVRENPSRIQQKILDHFNELGLKRIYVSNDIDGTDLSEAPATGTPESDGLPSRWIVGMTQQLRQHFEIIGGDIVEVAPPLSGSHNFSIEQTCVLAAHYLKAML
jgi:agmatinase